MPTQTASSAPGSSGRVVAITGGGKGLGRAFALACAADGARVVVNNRNHPGVPSSARETVDLIRAAGGEAVACDGDVRDPEAPARLMSAALDTYGRLDALILNAAVTGVAARVEDLSLADFGEVMAINVTANIALAQAAIRHLRASGQGRLLFVASSAGLYGVRGRAPYAASKGALIAMALSLAQELRRDAIGVNVLAPYAATQMTPDALNAELGESLAAGRAAPMAAWLTSPACKATGEIWTAGGGYLRRARVEEGLGAGPEDLATLSPSWIAENLERLSDMSQGVGYPDAEAAFADLLRRLQPDSPPV